MQGKQDWSCDELMLLWMVWGCPLAFLVVLFTHQLLRTWSEHSTPVSIIIIIIIKGLLIDLRLQNSLSPGAHQMQAPLLS